MKRLRLWLALLFASICSLQGIYAEQINTDFTSSVTCYSWHWGNKDYWGYKMIESTRVPSVITSDGRTAPMVESEHGTIGNTGTIFSRTISNLPNGMYTVVLYANAFNSSVSNSTIEPIIDGSEDIAYVFAGDKQIGIKAFNAVSSEKNGEYTLTNIAVSDGKISIGLGKWKGGTNIHMIQIKSLVLNSELVDVKLLEPGSLGTEILYNVNHLKDVTALKITGAINSEDWNKIYLLDNLVYLDMKGANTTKIPDGAFSLDTSYGRKAHCPHLKTIKLPEILKTIGNGAFYYSHVSDVEFPDSLSEIGVEAFEGASVKSVSIPNVTILHSGAFVDCTNLQCVEFSDSLESIPSNCFDGCTLLELRKFPNKLKHISGCAFRNCKNVNVRFHDSLEFIGDEAFKGSGIDSLIIPDKTTVGTNNAFAECGNLIFAEFPTSFYYNHYYSPIRGCSNLRELMLKSPTVVGSSDGFRMLDGCPINVVVKVPDYLVNAYKLDEYWYNFKIEGFSTELVKNWEINQNLNLYARDRFKGSPNIKINAGLNILGDDGMDIDTLTLINGGRFISHNDGVRINGELFLDYTTTKNTWYFISLPFDIKVSDIVPANGGKYAIRYYDGAGRALNGATGNWKNYEADDIIEAGTGFIYQTSQDGWTTFVSLDNESKQNIASNKMFVKALEANPSEKNSNKGWNLVGNPWQAYFNNHSVNFTAPITVWNGSTYVAYSLIDDDYAIKPNEAFFVQCPEEINSISFPITGRQMTSEITNQSGAKPRMFGANLENRQLIDLSVAKGDLMDKTRVVVNEGASADYETGVDASKFFSMDGTVPQVYTLVGEATECAINERPVAEGLVKVGFMAPEEGSYTFALVRNEAKTVMLIDHETGTTTDLTAGEYNFTAAQGTWNNRFELMITPAEPTAIEGVDGNKDTKVTATDEGIVVEGTEGRVVVYSVDGKKVAEQPVDGTATISVAKGTYLVRTAKGTAKVTVR